MILPLFSNIISARRSGQYLLRHCHAPKEHPLSVLFSSFAFALMFLFLSMPLLSFSVFLPIFIFFLSLSLLSDVTIDLCEATSFRPMLHDLSGVITVMFGYKFQIHLIDDFIVLKTYFFPFTLRVFLIIAISVSVRWALFANNSYRDIIYVGLQAEMQSNIHPIHASQS